MCINTFFSLVLYIVHIYYIIIYSMVDYYIDNSVEDTYIYSILIYNVYLYNVYNISGAVGRLPNFPHQRPWPGGRRPDTPRRLRVPQHGAAGRAGAGGDQPLQDRQVYRDRGGPGGECADKAQLGLPRESGMSNAGQQRHHQGRLGGVGLPEEKRLSHENHRRHPAGPGVSPLAPLR